MNKLYCDICNKEIINPTEVGHLSIVKKMLLEAEPRIVKQDIDLCETCINKVWELLEEIKKEKK